MAKRTKKKIEVPVVPEPAPEVIQEPVPEPKAQPKMKAGRFADDPFTKFYESTKEE